ncbi:glycosyltransferase family 4 protein [Hyphococcus luteus]|uniref:Glycosyl transferase n=1 Tax=Hyphococcus luteus TaxID=2058213 RepID=A0A2S7KA25_9PROT|nr:glycosyltransferase family 4 protein [Marinicaulis flavus]PQA89333.1 glycosyl transferase [Marinicaulis flavus]
MSRFEKTILQVVPRLNTGGAERTTLEIAEAVVRAGGRALVACEGGRLEKDIENAGGEILHVPVASKNPLTIWLNAGALAAIVRREKVDLIHARSRAPAWSALAAARRTHIPFVTTYHGAYSATGKVKRLYNSSMLRGDRVIANSRFTAERIMDLGGIEPARLAVIPRGVDVDLFDPKKISAERINQATAAWGLGENPGVKLLMPARISPWKGHETAIAALKRLKGRFGGENATGQRPGLTLVFCGGAQGSEALEKRLRAACDESGVRAMIHFVGDCADMPAAYAWADAVLAPSTEPEAFGRVAVEAGAMEKPVIASRHGGARETIVDRETGFLAAPGDAKALAAAIEQVILMPVSARTVMGEKARARAVSLFSSAAMCDATLGVYRSLLAERA